MEPKKILFNINDDLKSSVIKYAAYYVDGSKDGVKDGNIDESEKEELTKLLSQNTIYQDELKNEAPDIAKIFGYTKSAEATVATKVIADKVVKDEQKTPTSAFLEYQKTMGSKAAYEKVVEEFKDKKDFAKELKNLKKDVKKYYRNLNADKYIAKAEKEFKDKHEYDVSQRKIRSRAKEIAAEEKGGKIDKWDKGAINGSNNLWSRITFKTSASKRIAQSASDNLSSEGAITNKDGSLRTYTMEQLQEKLGKDHPYLQKVDDGKGKQVTLLEKAGLIVRQSDDKFDIRNVWNLSGSHVGSDKRASRQEYSERNEKKLLHEKIINLIKDATGKDFSANADKDKYVNKIYHDLCGNGNEHKDYSGVIPETIFGATLGAGSTALALLMQGSDIVKGVVKNDNTVDVFVKLSKFAGLGNLKLEDGSSLNSLVENGQASLTTEGDVVHINIHQEYAQPFYHKASKHIAKNAAKAGMFTGAVALLDSLIRYGSSEQQAIRRLPGKCDEIKRYDEKGNPVYYNMDNFEEFQDYLDGTLQMNPLFREALKNIAAAYTDFKTDPEHPRLYYQKMKDDLNNYAGRGSDLSATELRRAIVDAMEKDEAERLTDACDEEEKKEKPQYTGKTRNIEGEVIKQKAPKTEKFEDWGVFASRYKCIEDYDKNFKVDPKTKNANLYARTMMKVMQAIKDDDYDIVRLQELTQKAMSKNWRAELQNVPGFDFKAYAALRGNKQTHTFGMTKQNMPTITITDGQMVKSDLCAPTAPLYKIGAQSGGIGKKVNLGDANNTRKGEKRFEGRLKTSYGDVISTNDEKVYDSEKTNLRKTYEWIEPEKATF